VPAAGVLVTRYDRDRMQALARLISWRSIALALLAWFASTASSGCATTAAWERETLAKRCMAPDPDPFREALRHHYLGTREGAVGGLGGGGGGCGCN
jgi:hypothetical protein